MSTDAKVVQIERNAKQIVIYLHFRDAAYFRGKASKLLFSFTFRYFLLFIYGLITISEFKGFNFMLFYANYLFIPLPYTIPLPLTGERDVSFWRYGVRCFISAI